jgi:hypothetical protein
MPMSDATPTCKPVHVRNEFPTPLQRAIYDAADQLFLGLMDRKWKRIREVLKMLDRAIELADAVTGSRNCLGCDQPFTPTRKDALCCSNRCRQRVYRKNQKPLDAEPLERRRQEIIGGLENQTCPTTPF